jgi:acetylornithine deacetylase
VPHATVGIGPIEGGTRVNIVPDRCRLDVEVRALPSQDPVALMGRVRALAGEQERAMRRGSELARVEVEELASYPGLRPDSDDGFARRLAAAAGTEAGGAVDFGTEAGLYQQALGVPVVVCGPGSMAVAHRADEHIAVEQLDRCVALLGTVLESLA